MKRYSESLTVTLLTKEDDDGLISAREALLIAILDDIDTSSAINNLLSVRVPLRKKFHVLEFCGILEHNSGSLDSLKKLAVALKVLEQYGKNLLQPAESRPKTWRLIKHSNKTFTDKVMIIEDGLYILQLIGYSESRQEGMSIPDGVEPDFTQTLNIVADIVLARREIEAYMSNCHPNPASVEAFLVYQKVKVSEQKVQSSFHTRIKEQDTTKQNPRNTTANDPISSNENSSKRAEPFKREELNETVETNDLQCSSDELSSRSNDGKEVKETVKDNDFKCSSDEILEDHQSVLQNDSKRLSIEQRFGQLSMFTKPEQLIYTDGDGKLAIRDTTMEQINGIDVPMVIVVICGSYRTGKSHLMNQLANAKKGFKLGNSVKGETKGIWAWLRPHPKQSDQVLLLLDTEGFSDIEKADTENDDQLFCLSALLSSMLIYNLKSAIGKDNLEKMSFITKMTKSIRLAAVGEVTDEDSEKLLLLLTPTFTMCLRDFHLELAECSEDDYLTDALKITPGPGKEAYNNTKECIKKYFPKRKCFTIPAPAQSRYLSKLEDLNEKDLDKGFILGLERLKTFVYNCSPKVFDAVTDKQADGLVFEAFARTYVQALRKGDAMTFTQASEKASELHNEKLVTALVNEYRQEVDAILLHVPKKLNLEETCLKLQSTKLQVFRKQSYPQKSDFYADQAMKEMEFIRQKKIEENIEKVQASLLKILEKIHEVIIQRRKAKYAHHLGASRYKEDVETVQSIFMLVTRNFDKDEQITALRNYERNIKDEEMRIEFLFKRHEEEEIRQKIQKKREELRKKYEDLIKMEKKLALEFEKDRMKQNFEQIMRNQKSESLGQKILRWFGF